MKTALLIPLLISLGACSTAPKVTPLPPRVTFITLAVDDLKKMSAFYDKMEWPRSERSNEHFVAYKTGGATLGLWHTSNFEKMGLKKDFRNFNGTTLAINVESPAQVDAALQKAQAIGAVILTPAKNTSWGGRSGCFKDPEGNIWEVTWVDGLEFDDRGAIYF